MLPAEVCRCFSLRILRNSVNFECCVYLLLHLQEGFEVLRSVCLCVCLSARIPQKPHVQTSPNFQYMIPIAMAQCSFDNSAVRFVLRFCGCFHIMGQIQIHVWNLQYSKLFTMTRQVVLLNCVPGDKVCYHRLCLLS